jgi:ketosteroid isomerase-like protein
MYHSCQPSGEALQSPDVTPNNASQSVVFAPKARPAELRLEPATASDIVEVVLDGYAQYNRGAWEPSLDHWHEDAEYLAAPEDPDSALHRGIDAIRRLFASWREVFPDLRVEVHEARAHRNRVFAWVRLVGRGAASGLPIYMELAHVFTMREGRTARLVEYMDRAEALKAVGLEG